MDWRTVAAMTVVAFLGLAGTLGAAWIAARANRQNSADLRLLETRKVNTSEFDSITRELNAAIKRLTDEASRERDLRLDAERAAEHAEESAETCARRVAALEARVETLEAQLRSVGLTPADAWAGPFSD